MVLLYCLKKDGQAFADEFDSEAEAVEFGDKYWKNASEATRRGLAQFAVVKVPGDGPACPSGGEVVKDWKGGARHGQGGAY